jgi:hypothetical protein
MKIRILVAFVGIAGSLAVTAEAQQKDTANYQLRQRLEALGQNYDEALAVLVTETGPAYGREAIHKYYTDLFHKVHFNDWITATDQYSPHAIGTAGNEVWETGKWSGTIQGQTSVPYA